LHTRTRHGLPIIVDESEPKSRSLRGEAKVQAFPESRFAKLADTHRETIGEICCGNTDASEPAITGTLPNGKKIQRLGYDIDASRGGKMSLRTRVLEIIREAVINGR
jgi:hypothetical protein